VTIPGWETQEVELFADLETPVSVFLKLRRHGARFLLETVERGTTLGRFSFIGLHPLVEIECSPRRTRILTSDGRTFECPDSFDPSRVLGAFLDLLRATEPPGPGDLLGGAVGYLSYEYIQFIERIPAREADASTPPLARFIIPRTWVSFDHLRRRMHLRSMRPSPSFAQARSPVEPDTLTRLAREALLHALHQLQSTPSGPAELDTLVCALREPLTELSNPRPNQRFRPMAEPDQPTFERSVARAKEYIRQGDIFQVVLSQRRRGALPVHPFQVYRALRMLNPSPYLFYVDFAPTILIGSSPELLVKLEGREATVRPIAGTRRRGQTPKEDREIERELIADAKEQAEHVMLVDLGRNDLGRVCEYGSVSVTDFMAVERYSHVMHLVSYVRGQLQPGLDRFDLLRATFPAGTVSGAPKVRAMEIIHELELFRRGPYAGALGYFGPSGEMDLCITIRTVVCEGGTATLQAGAGIVADSDPAREHLECQGKMQVLLDAIQIAEEGIK